MPKTVTPKPVTKVFYKVITSTLQVSCLKFTFPHQQAFGVRRHWTEHPEWKFQDQSGNDPDLDVFGSEKVDPINSRLIIEMMHRNHRFGLPGQPTATLYTTTELETVTEEVIETDTITTALALESSGNGCLEIKNMFAHRRPSSYSTCRRESPNSLLSPPYCNSHEHNHHCSQKGRCKGHAMQRLTIMSLSFASIRID